MAHEASSERQWLEHSVKVNVSKVLLQSNNLNLLSLIRIIISFLFFFASLPCMYSEFTNGLSTLRMMLSIESMAKLWISHNQVHCRELHYKDSIGLKF